VGTGNDGVSEVSSPAPPAPSEVRPAALSHLWAELPNGRWQLRASDDFWYQLDQSGTVILSPHGVRATTVSGNLDDQRRSVERIYREALERKITKAQRDEMEAKAALAALNRTVAYA